MTRPTDWDAVFGFGDPTPGDPWEIRAVARTWARVSAEASYAEGRLRGLLGDGALVTWLGQAGEQFRSRSSDVPGQLGKVEESYDLAAQAMSWWADRLEIHQGQADRALVQGRDAKSDLESARSRLDTAERQVWEASGVPALSAAALAPTPEQVQAAQDRLQAARDARDAAQGLVDSAETRFDAARSLAEDAREARESDARTTARKIHEAAEAGIEPRSRWEKFKDGVSDAWDVLVTIAKVVVAVLGVVVLIIGGPLAWVVLAAALIVLADSLIKYAQGEGSLLDVGLAALGCIPGTKGLTTFAALSSAFRTGGTLGAIAHVGSALRSAGVALAQTARTLRSGFVPGIRTAVRVLGQEDALAIPQLRTTLHDIARGFVSVDNQVSGMAAQARSWQGSGAFPGIDDYANRVLAAGDRLEAGFPGLSNYATSGGTAAANGNSASRVWEGLQVGPNQFDYRPSMVELRINNPVDAAHGTALANPQYGAGGAEQFFLDIKGGLASGDISVLDSMGNPIDLGPINVDQVESAVSNALGGSGTIQLSGAGAPNPSIAYQADVIADPGSFHAPDLGQANVDASVQESLDAITRTLQATGYYGGGS